MPQVDPIKPLAECLHSKISEQHERRESEENALHGGRRQSLQHALLPRKDSGSEPDPEDESNDNGNRHASSQENQRSGCELRMCGVRLSFATWVGMPATSGVGPLWGGLYARQNMAGINPAPHQDRHGQDAHATSIQP